MYFIQFKYGYNTPLDHGWIFKNLYMLPVIKTEPNKNYLPRILSFISMFYEEFVPVFEFGLFGHFFPLIYYYLACVYS